MKHILFYIGATGVMGTMASALDGCGNSEPTAELRQVSHGMQARSRAVLRTRSNETDHSQSLVISTYLHVVESIDRVGLVTQKQLDDQMVVLNERFAPHNIQFTVKNTTHTVNDAWANSIRHADKAKALRQGAYDDLNLYFTSGLVNDEMTGFCEFPDPDPRKNGINGTSYYEFDGCHINPSTLPGGAGASLNNSDNKGVWAVHEVGHWFGLFHTFDTEACDNVGDAIDDTPAQSVANRGCPMDPPQDSCPGLEGLDAIHNYMDYTSDDCKTEFSPLQGERMLQLFTTLRHGK